MANVVMVGVIAAAEDGLVPSPEPGWPQWRGRRRDGVSRETGLLPSWPRGGPKRLWKASGLGRGYSSPSMGFMSNSLIALSSLSSPISVEL